MKKILKYSVIFLMMSTPLYSMEKQQPSISTMQECYCERKFQPHRLGCHISVHHVIMESNKKKYVCPKKGCNSPSYSKPTEVISHMICEHHFSRPQVTPSPKTNDEPTGEGVDLWATDDNTVETSNSKSPCACGRIWPQGKQARIAHIKNYHCRSVNFKKTYDCNHTDCNFSTIFPELIVEHQSTHPSTIKPRKKIKKGSKRPQQKKPIPRSTKNPVPILPNIDQLPCASSSPTADDYPVLDNFLQLQPGELEELFPFLGDSTIEN